MPNIERDLQIHDDKKYLEELERKAAKYDALMEEVIELRKDKQRLNYLDKLSHLLNERYGTNYGWEFIVNENVTRLFFKSLRHIDLNNAKAYGFKTVREAIDRRLAANTIKEMIDE